MSRVLKPQGIAVLSDPIPSPPDEGEFIDEFQRLQPDGHKQFYQKQVLIGMFDREGIELIDTFESSITGPREMDARYEILLGGTSEAILDAYSIGFEGETITFTLKVMNTLFKKRG